MLCTKSRIKKIDLIGKNVKRMILKILWILALYTGNKYITWDRTEDGEKSTVHKHTHAHTRTHFTESPSWKPPSFLSAPQQMGSSAPSLSVILSLCFSVCLPLSVGSSLLILVLALQSTSPPIASGAHSLLSLLFRLETGLKKRQQQRTEGSERWEIWG